MYDLFGLPEFHFPDNFLWGSSVAGHQVEGMNDNADFWHYEQHMHSKDPSFELSGMACNHYELFREDCRLIRNLGHRAFRFSLEWARIEPDDGHFCDQAMQHYLDELECLKQNGIKVVLTLIHFTVPQWFSMRGYFNTLDNLGIFERYLKYVVPKVAPYVDYWVVLNEFNLGIAPERVTFKLNALRYHAAGYHIIKAYSDKPVSSAHAYEHYMPYRDGEKYDRIMCDYMDFCDNDFFFHAIRTGEILFPFRDACFCPELKDSCDYWAVNYYTRAIINARRSGEAKGPRYLCRKIELVNMDTPFTEMTPEDAICFGARLRDKPIFITENGCCSDDDRMRIVFLAEYLCAVSEAISDNAPIIGYLHWSTFDNYEWGSYTPRFGLVDVDRLTFERTPKPSALFYRDIINQNGCSQTLIRRYLDSLPSRAYRPEK